MPKKNTTIKTKRLCEHVWLLWHIHVFSGGEEDVKLLGVFSTRQLALDAKKTLKSQPGFKQHPHGFIIEKYEIDKRQWTEGFITV